LLVERSLRWVQVSMELERASIAPFVVMVMVPRTMATPLEIGPKQMAFVLRLPAILLA